MKPLSLYIHVPFCKRACPYCTFYHVSASAGLVRAFAGRAAEEIELELAAVARCRGGNASGSGRASLSLRTLYVGGGTPSIIPAQSLEEILAPVYPWVDDGSGGEWTIELNPEDVTGELLDKYVEMGFNRASVGIQSMNPRVQEVLGRSSPAINRAAMEAVQARFETVNADLLLGIPGIASGEVIESARALLAFEPQHLSVYCLEGGGSSSAAVAAFLSRVDQEEAAAQYLALCNMLDRHGYLHYEVSNFARPGFESKHNRTYWEGGDYLGIGPAAHSFVGGIRRRNRSSLEIYLANRGETFDPVRRFDSQDERERRLERLFLGLRTSRGISLEMVEGMEDVIDALTANGLASVAGERLTLTDRGFLLLDEIVVRLADRSE